MSNIVLDNITYKTQIKDLINHEDISNIVDSLKTSVLSSCNARRNIIATGQTSGALTQDTIVPTNEHPEGEAKYYSLSQKCDRKYYDVMDKMALASNRTMMYTQERERLELSELKNRLVRRSEEIQNNVRQLNSEYEGRKKGDAAAEEESYDKYYGSKGAVTLARTELGDLDIRIYEVNMRLSKLNGHQERYDKLGYRSTEIIIENAIGAPEDEWEKGATNKYGETTYTYKTPEGITVEKIVKDGHVLYYQAKYQDIEGSKGFNQCEYVYFDSSGEKISYYDSEALKKTSRSDYNNTTLWSKDGNNYSYKSGESLYNSNTIVTTDSDGKPLFYVVGIGSEAKYYNANYERISAGQAERLATTHKVTMPTVPEDPPEPPTEPAGEPVEYNDPTEPTEAPSEPSTTSSTEPSTVPSTDPAEGPTEPPPYTVPTEPSE